MVGFGPVGARGHRTQRSRLVEVVGVVLASFRRPRKGTAAPCFGQWHHVVDIDTAGVGDVLVVVGRVPESAGKGAFRADLGCDRGLGDQHFSSRAASVVVRVRPMLVLVALVAVMDLVGNGKRGDRVAERHGHG